MLKPSLRATVLAVVTMLAPLSPAADAAEGPFERAVFAPELLMKHQRRIGLTSDQREVFISEMRRTQSELLPLQLEMSEVASLFAERLKETPVDEESTLSVGERVLELEQRIKIQHMVLLIRIKNLLTPEQHAMLRRIRDAE